MEGRELLANAFWASGALFVISVGIALSVAILLGAISSVRGGGKKDGKN